jgi:hypothetical protein
MVHPRASASIARLEVRSWRSAVVAANRTLTGRLVLWELFELLLEPLLAGGSGSEMPECCLEVRLGSGRLVRSCAPAGTGCRVEALAGVGDVASGLVAVVDGRSEVPAGETPFAAAVGSDALLERLQTVREMQEGVAEDVGAVGERVVGLCAGDGDVGQWASSWSWRRAVSPSRQPSLPLKASRAACTSVARANAASASASVALAMLTRFAARATSPARLRRRGVAGEDSEWVEIVPAAVRAGELPGCVCVVLPGLAERCWVDQLDRLVGWPVGEDGLVGGDDGAKVAVEGVGVGSGGSDNFLTTWIVDPDGNRIELVQWPAGHLDGISAADWAD